MSHIALAQSEALPATTTGDVPVVVQDSAPQDKVNKSLVFDVLEFRVSGNALLDVQDIERTLYPFLGPNKVFADIEKARAALEQHYRDAGLLAVLVDIPEQSVSSGIVWLKVTESRIATRRISGSRYYSPRLLAEQVSALEPGNTLQMTDVQAQINNASAAFPERLIIPTLRPGRTPGTLEVELQVKDQLPLHAELEINDRFGENTSRWRAGGSVDYSNLWQRGHSLKIQYQTAPIKTDQVKVWSATYLLRVPKKQSLMAIYAVDSKSNIATLGDLNVIGNGSIYGIRWINPWRTGDTLANTLSLGLDYKDFSESIQLQGADLSSTPISYLAFSVDFSVIRQLGQQASSFRLSSGFGVRGLGNDTAEFADKRYLAQANYLFLRANVEHSQPLFMSTHLHLEMEGQVADSALISNEQYAAGGVATVRGYHESQALGDDAIRGKVEWLTPSLLNLSMLSKDKPAIQNFHGMLFWDSALLHVQDALPGQAAQTQLASVGVGLRMSEGTAWQADMDCARALKAAGSVAKGDRRCHLSLRVTF